MMNSRLIELIGLCAEHMRLMCLKHIGSITLIATASDTMAFRSPALQPNLMFHDIDLNEMSRLLYDDEPVSDAEIQRAWKRAVDMLNDRDLRELYIGDIFAELLPSIPFESRVRGEFADLLVQFLVAASWQTGKLGLTGTSATLRINKCRLAIEQQACEWPGGRRRLKFPLSFNAARIARSPIGKARVVSQKLTAIHGFFCRHFPEYAPHMEHIMTVALRADQESMLTEQFDIERVGEVIPRDAMFSKAIELVQTAETQPYAKVVRLLRRKLPLDVIRQHLKREFHFSDNIRADYILSIRLLQKIFTERNSSANIPDPVALRELMELQQMIRGR